MYKQFLEHMGHRIGVVYSKDYSLSVYCKDEKKEIVRIEKNESPPDIPSETPREDRLLAGQGNNPKETE